MRRWLAGAHDTMRFPIETRCEHLLFSERVSYLFAAIAIKGQHEDSPYNRCCLRVNDPTLGPIWVFDVAIRRLTHRNPSVASDFVTYTALFAYVSAVPLVEQVADGRKLVFSLIGVYGVGYGY